MKGTGIPRKLKPCGFGVRLPARVRNDRDTRFAFLPGSPGENRSPSVLQKRARNGFLLRILNFLASRESRSGPGRCPVPHLPSFPGGMPASQRGSEPCPRWFDSSPGSERYLLWLRCAPSPEVLRTGKPIPVSQTGNAPVAQRQEQAFRKRPIPVRFGTGARERE